MSTPPAPEPDEDVLAFAARVFDLSRHGDAQELGGLLDGGLSANLRNHRGDSLLMLASYNENIAAVRTLLAHGADPDGVNDKGQVPLSGVAFKGNAAVAQLLLDGGATPDGPPGTGRTPLMMAAMFDRVEIADMLLKQRSWLGHRGRTVCRTVDGTRRGCRAALRPRPLHRRPRHPARHPARGYRALAPCPRRHHQHRRRGGARASGRRRSHHRLRSSRNHQWARAGGAGRHRCPCHGGRPGALCRQPVAVVVARDRYVAEDGCDLIEPRYEVRDAVVDPVAALGADAPVLHDGVGANLVSERHFRYGDPETAFAEAAHELAVTVRYPRNTGAPMETYGVVAEYDPTDDSYDVLANFQGPFSIHAVVARALKVPGNRLRLRTPPDSGGSFGVKQGVAPYTVLIAAAARLVGRPVKWIEDRLEHLSASVSATNRVTTLKAAFDGEGRVTALDWDQIEDCGAYLRAPEPATLYRMHGNLTGAYAIRNVRVRNRVVVTNKTPTGLVRGFGGPQVYYPLERLIQRIAKTLDLDPFTVIRRNLVPANAFPYRTATGALYDSGNYQRALDEAARDGGLEDLKRRREAARAEGRLYGIGLTAAVEPSVSNMGYITTVLTPAERAKAGPKNGAQSTATITLDPVGSVTVQVASVPQGQGHRTVLAQVVADVLGIPMRQVRVTTDLDTAKDAWSIASGNYSSRFAAAVAGATHMAAAQLRDKLARIAAAQLNVRADDLVFAEGRVASRTNPDAGLPFARVAATSHWSPALVPDAVGAAIRETVFWTPPELTAPDADDLVNSSLCHGFIFDLCGVEVDRVTGRLRIDRYVSMHDCGRILHPGMVEGQVRGGFAQALGAAVYEELSYGDDGAFLSGTFADYLLPTATEVPEIEILHLESPSPFTPLGAKGVGEGNCMSTPVCLANAVADALGLDEIDLPLTPAKLAALAAGADEPAPPAGRAAQKPAGKPGDRTLRGEGSASVAAPPEKIWAMLLDADVLASVIPGSHGVKKLSDTHFHADVSLGVGPVKGRYKAEITLSDLDAPRAATLAGTVTGALGNGGGSGRITLEPDGSGGTHIAYRYEASVGGKVAAIGGRLLDGAARIVIGGFFAALARRAGGARGRFGVVRRLLARLGRSA